MAISTSFVHGLSQTTRNKKFAYSACVCKIFPCRLREIRQKSKARCLKIKTKMAASAGEMTDAESEIKKRRHDCMCTFHENWKEFTNGNSVLHIERAKVHHNIVRFMRDHLFLGPRSNFLCKSAIHIDQFRKIQFRTTFNQNSSKLPVPN